MNENFNGLGELGEKLKDIVDAAVSSKDYRQMTQEIKQTVGETVNKAVNSAVDTGGEAVKDGWNKMFGADGKYKNWTRAFETQKKQERELAQKREETKKKLAVLYEKNYGGKAKGVVMAIFGGILASGMGIGTLIFSAIAATIQTDPILLGILGIMAAGTASGVGLLVGGIRKIGRLGRFQKYIDALDVHTYCSFDQLSDAVSKPVKFVKKDVQKMISKGWFRQGHIDAQETCLITSNETYQQYMQTQNALEQKKREEERLREENLRNHEKILPQEQEILEKGKEYLDKLHKSNDAIPGIEISAKISRMELIVEKIFERARKHPEIIPDLKKMMDYYLPMTVKLLDAYEEMDVQPVQRENIQSSKKEIEDTLDTLNLAFEKLLDSVFQDTAWDVSSDISVLNTLLAQEGLTEDEFSL